MFNQEKAEYLKKVALRTISIINLLEKGGSTSQIAHQLEENKQLKGVNHDRQMVEYYRKVLNDDRPRTDN